MQEEAKVGGRYLNKKTGRIYIVLHNALLAKNYSYQRLVVYQEEGKDATDQIWVIRLEEFNEKFKLLD
jgi:hypothetical protein